MKVAGIVSVLGALAGTPSDVSFEREVIDDQPPCDRRVESVGDLDGDVRPDMVPTLAEGEARISGLEAPADPTSGGGTEHVIEPPSGPITAARTSRSNRGGTGEEGN